MIRMLCYIVLAAFMFSSCSTKPKSAVVKKGFNFVESPTLSRIIDQANSENKLVFVDVYTDWCLPCKMMDADVFTDKSIIEFFKTHFVSYKVDAEKDNGRNLSFLYSVDSYPTLLFLDTKGRVLERKEGAAYHSELMQMARNALNINNNGIE